MNLRAFSYVGAYELCATLPGGRGEGDGDGEGDGNRIDVHGIPSFFVAK